MKIVLDVMGGDNAPVSTVKGAILAKKEFDADIVLVGDKDKIEAILKEENADGFEIVDTKVEVTMKDDPNVVLKQKRDSSMGISLDMLAKGEADAFVTAGSTGAVLTGATLIVKRIKGIRRAALSPIIPTKTGGALLIDCGANSVCTEEYLTQFAILGNIYYKLTSDNKNPRVALINNGAESSKGTPMIKETYAKLEELSKQGVLNFTGNIEGRDIATGGADILVTDGFTGNVLLKTYEGVGMYIFDMVKGILKKNIITKFAAVLLASGLKELKKAMDYKEVGGAPLLGIKKPVIKAHGSANDYAIRSAIKQAINYTESGVIEAIEEEIAKINL